MRRYFRYSFIMLVIMLLWDASIIQPLKVFASYIHQSGHLIAGIVFSYSIGNDLAVSITNASYKILNKKSFFSAFAIANAGYIMNALFAHILIRLKDSPTKKYAVGILALFYLAIAVKFANTPSHILYAALFAGVAIAIHLIQKEDFYSWIMDVVAGANFAYVFYEVFVNIIYYELNAYFHFAKWTKAIPYSDALQLQNLTHIPAVVWGGFWLVAFIFTFFLYLRSRAEEEASE